MDENNASSSRLVCECGKNVSPPRGAELSREWVEVHCACGRRLDLERSAGGWTVRMALVPEKSVPLDGFSRELRLRKDTLRFWFQDFDGAGRRTNVHVVFSPSHRIAEIKRGDARALKLSDVSSPSEARRRWLERQSGPRARQERRAGL